MQKDYSLLRPFDTEAAKLGEAVAWWSDGETAKQVVFMDSGQVAIEWLCGNIIGYDIADGDTRFLRMAPLAWVEGKPVYKGDVLYWKAQQTSPCVAEKIMEGGWLAFRASDNEPCGLIHPDGLTWTPPKVKREVKLLAWLCDSCLCWMTEGFPVNKDYIRVPSEDKVIEIEESIVK